MDIDSECRRLNDEILNHYNDWIQPPAPRTMYVLRNGGSTIGGPKYEQMLRELRDQYVKIDDDGFVNIQEEHLIRFHPLIQSKYRQLRKLLLQSANGKSTLVERTLAQETSKPNQKLTSNERTPLKAFLKELLRKGETDRTKLLTAISNQGRIYDHDPWIESWREKKEFEKLTWTDVQNHGRPRGAFSTMISKLSTDIRAKK